jgi:hypothetical protein
VGVKEVVAVLVREGVTVVVAVRVSVRVADAVGV